jgi:hypothetical protein
MGMFASAAATTTNLDLPATTTGTGRDTCCRAAFDLATALVFNGVDVGSGQAAYRALAEGGDAEAIVATGICLLEAPGSSELPNRQDEVEGMRWLARVSENSKATQCAT